jgi:hypothetical protein
LNRKPPLVAWLTLQNLKPALNQRKLVTDSTQYKKLRDKFQMNPSEIDPITHKLMVEVSKEDYEVLKKKQRCIGHKTASGMEIPIIDIKVSCLETII